MISKNQKPVIIWLFTGCFLVFAMVIIGGITRLTGSGLSITEWDVIMGAIPPLNHADWMLAFEKYKQSPQFHLVNFDMDLSQFKSIFFWEYFHRLVGRLIGLVFIFPFLYFLWKKKFDSKRIPQLIVLFCLGGFQGFLGWYMVKSGLVDNPAVSHYRLAAHLITAFITFGYTLWIALSLIYPEGNQTGAKRPFRGIALTIYLLIIVQIIYGAFVANLHGGSFYNTWPKMGNDWFPDTIMGLKPGWTNFFDNPIGVQVVHRYIALSLVVLGIILYFMYQRNPDKRLKGSLIFFLSALTLQFTLGVITLLYAAPIVLAVFHQIGGFVLFTSSVILLHRSRKS